MRIILSPAKSLNENPACPDLKFTEPVFLKDAETVMSKLKKVSAKKLESLMDISKDLALLNFDRNQKWNSNLKSEVNFPAAFGFTGQAYIGLDFTTLTKKEQERGQEKLRILSGLYGLLKPFDLIQPYRLEMGTSLPVSAKAKNLYQFWGDKIRKQLEQELAQEKNPFLVNVASSEYFKAAQLPKFKYPIITCVFKDIAKDGTYKVNMTYAKQARGAMVRFVLKENIQKINDLKAFDVDGYYFSSKESTSSDFVYLRG